MISYILYFSKPQGKDNKEIKGIFITLSHTYREAVTDFRSGDRLKRVFEREDVSPSIKIYNIEVDPRLGRKNEENVIRMFRLIFK